MEQKLISAQAKTAKAIRSELKNAYPNTKFSVTSESFSMGNSVDIRWTDGPTSEQVSKITDKYQYGHFDGMTDMYENSNNRDDIPQSKYVMTKREMSDETKQKIIKEHNDKFSEECQIKDYNSYNKGFNEWNHTVVYRTFNKLVVA